GLPLPAGLALFAGSIGPPKLWPSGFTPPEATARPLLAVELPPGWRLPDTDAVTRRISGKITALPEVRSVLVFGGQILGGASEVRKATLVVNLVHKSKRDLTQKEVEIEIARTIADVPDVPFWFLPHTRHP